jgi:hypothetical protein
MLLTDVYTVRPVAALTVSSIIFTQLSMTIITLSNIERLSSLIASANEIVSEWESFVVRLDTELT